MQNMCLAQLIPLILSDKKLHPQYLKLLLSSYFATVIHFVEVCQAVNL